MGASSDPRIDESRWPIVTLRFSAESTDEEWRVLMDHVRACHRRGERFSVIADGTVMKGMPTAKQRKIGADLALWLRENAPKGARWPIMAWGNVITSPLVRGALTAILWIDTPPHPQKVFATFAEAFAWVKSVTDAERRG
jgi:hypothetical protein